MRQEKRMRVMLVITGLVLAAVVALGILPNATTQAWDRSGQAEASWLESDDALVVQSGNWAVAESDSASGGRYLLSSAPSDVLGLKFSGAVLQVQYITGPDSGTLAIEVDNVVLRTLVTSSDVVESAVVSIDYLSAGTHVLEVYAVEGSVGIDAFYAAALVSDGLADPVAPPAAVEPVDDAVAGVPEVLNKPSGKIYSSTPNFEFTLDFPTDTNFYVSIVNQLTMSQVHGAWYPVSTYCVSGTCAIRPPGLTLPAAVYKWKVKSWGSSGERPFSAELAFEVDLPNAISPSGLFQDLSESAGNISYEWSGTDSPQRETWYEVLVVNPVPNPDVMLKSVWFEASTINCTVSCRANPSTFDNSFSLTANQPYLWYLRAWGPEGYGPWGGPFNFTLNMPPSLAVPSKIVPGGTIDDTYYPEFAWRSTEGASYYNLVIETSAGAVVQNNWYKSSVLGCYRNPFVETECGFAEGKLPFYLVNGNYRWKVRSYGPGGTGPFSDYESFTIAVLPTYHTPFGVNEAFNRGDVTFEWEHEEFIEYYQFELRNAANTVIYTSTIASEELCEEITCELNSGKYIGILAQGSYKWKVRSWTKQLGFSTYSSERTFLIAPPAAVTPSIANFKPVSTPANAENLLVYEWDDVANATWYQLYVDKGSGAAIIDKWFRRMDADAIACNGTLCSTQPDIYLGPGNYRMYVRGWGPGGMGSYSAPHTFSVGGPTLGAHSYTSPAAASVVTNADPDFVWAMGANALHYEFYLGYGSPITALVSDIYSTDPMDDDPLICDAGVCTLDLDLELAHYNGYKWFVRGYSPGTVGAWDAGITFSVHPATLPAPVLTFPAHNGVNGSGPATFTWGTVPHAKWYLLQFRQGTTVIAQQWYEGAVVCDEACSVIVANPPVGRTSWRVQAWSPLPLTQTGAFSTERSLTQLIRTVP